jgi:hypothetical protein
MVRGNLTIKEIYLVNLLLQWKAGKKSWYLATNLPDRRWYYVFMPVEFESMKCSVILKDMFLTWKKRGYATFNACLT